MKMKALLMAIVIGSTTTLAVASVDHHVVNQAALAKATTVKQALTLPDDAKVELKGYIVQSLGDEKYTFQDATGSITVEIDDELWNGKAISNKTLITIVGEVDIDYKPTKRVKIDVDQVRF